MGNLVIQTTQIPHKSLVLIFPQITFQEELFEFPSVLFHTLGSLFEVMEFEVVIMDVVGGRNLAFSLSLICAQVRIFPFPFLAVLVTKLAHQIEAFAKLKGYKFYLFLIRDVLVLENPLNRS